MYSITEIAKITGLSTSTLRYYEQIGILPGVTRNELGRRVYDERILEWIELILALKDTGMSIENIKQYTDLVLLGDSTLNERRDLLLQHKKEVERKIISSQLNLEKIIRKVALYDILMYQENNVKIKNKKPLV
ncbi:MULTISPECIES: MerR family transcriptional regulator [unclassified Bacillus (in: firmicutes)]